MTLKYIIEICVAIDIAILGIAYPIVIDKISNIGDKYNSNYLSEVFKFEFPHNLFKASWLRIEWSLFKTLLILTILSFLPLILNQKPLFGLNNVIINNSADLIVLVMTSLLTFFFFVWIDKVSLFNGKSTKLLNHVIKKYNKSGEEYYLKTINEISLFSIKHQDEHLQKTLREFYHGEFYKIRNNHIEKTPLIYPSDLYQLVNQISLELINSESKQLSGLQHRAVSGQWLLGGDMAQVRISKETYNSLWSIIYLINSKPKLVKMFWANSHQYFRFDLKQLQNNFDSSRGTVSNTEEVLQRELERDEFLEFHHALGGLLLYKNQYQTIYYIFNYSQSMPPDYVLLPKTMTDIFNLFESFRNKYRSGAVQIENKYYFPELDNLGNSHQVIYWICSYITLLFVRQFNLKRSFRNEDFTSEPILPTDVYELNNWKDGLPFFKKCLDDICEKKDLLNQLEFTQLVTDKKPDFDRFLNNLESNIASKIGREYVNAEISEDKRKQFYSQTKRIISGAFNEYKEIFQSKENIEDEKDNIHLSLRGSKTLFQKSAFSDDGATHLNYDTIFAESISRQVIMNYIPSSFLIARTRRYLISKETLNSALKRLNINNNQFKIVVFNPDYNLMEYMEEYSPILIELPATEFRNTLFVLKKKDLPAIIYKDYPNFEKDNLKCIDEEFKIYASVLDLNKPDYETVKQQWPNEEELEAKVELAISFESILLWKKDRDVVQINIESQFEEQGVSTEIDDISPFVSEVKE